MNFWFTNYNRVEIYEKAEMQTLKTIATDSHFLIPIFVLAAGVLLLIFIR